MCGSEVDGVEMLLIASTSSMISDGEWRNQKEERWPRQLITLSAGFSSSPEGVDVPTPSPPRVDETLSTPPAKTSITRFI
uniref:Uncharacterized protein n=1 Tax=Globodera rostochiensis TaxID=31243 RepID=A0A914HI35_GLORO